MNARYRRNTTPLLEAQTSPHAPHVILCTHTHTQPHTDPPALPHPRSCPPRARTLAGTPTLAPVHPMSSHSQYFRAPTHALAALGWVPYLTRTGPLSRPALGCLLRPVQRGPEPRLSMGGLPQALGVAGARCSPFDHVHRPWPPHCPLQTPLVGIALALRRAGAPRRAVRTSLGRAPVGAGFRASAGCGLPRLQSLRACSAVVPRRACRLCASICTPRMDLFRTIETVFVPDFKGVLVS